MCRNTNQPLFQRFNVSAFPDRFSLQRFGFQLYEVRKNQSLFFDN